MAIKKIVKEVVLWGATGQAKVLKECLEYSGVKVTALFDNNKEIRSPFRDTPIYYGKDGFEDWLSKIEDPMRTGFLVAIGGDKGKDRIEIHEYLQSRGLIPFIAIHPTAFVANNSKVGEGSQILAHSSVCAGSVIGKSCIINTGAIVDHECIIENGVHVCPGATLAGCVSLGRYSTVGTGAVILPRIKVGRGAMIGAGAVVIKHVAPYTVVAGNPAKVIKKIKV